ncbi:MAG: methionyl-tRNA formyltransferase [Burkholderiales bacterium]|nr:methionyl-tRNA formyltransferase [Burkholderiales bacterium]
MRVAYAGTPAFAATALAALLEAGHEVPLVLTQPDRPAGRGLALQASPVKQLALARGLALAQPRSLRLDGRWPEDAGAARQALQAAAPDVMVVAAYGLILPPWVLEGPRLGCLNIHASLLPRWRGAAPIQRALEAGDAQTGITLMQMDAGLDTGAVLMAQALPIGPEDTSASLHERLAVLGAGLVVQALAALRRGPLPARAQPDEGASYAPKIDKAEAAIDWRLPAAVIERRLRAFDPFPGATTVLGGQPVKLWRGRVVPGQGEPGRVLRADAGALVLACGEGALELLTLQRAGAGRVTAREFLQRHPLAPGAQAGAGVGR